MEGDYNERLQNFLKPRVITQSLTMEVLKDIEYANYCVVIVLTDGMDAKYIHFRTTHTFQDVMQTLSDETLGSGFKPRLNFLYGSNDDFEDSSNLVGFVKQAMSLLVLKINFEDIGGQYDRMGHLNNQKFSLERISFVGKRREEIDYVFN